jgi:hypothetical protein
MTNQGLMNIRYKRIPFIQHQLMPGASIYFYELASYIMYLSDFCRFLLCTCGWERRAGEGEGLERGGENAYCMGTLSVLTVLTGTVNTLSVPLQYAFYPPLSSPPFSSHPLPPPLPPTSSSERMGAITQEVFSL